jgi:hypothetical protein
METESREWTEEELKLFLKYLCRHVVAVVLEYKVRDCDGALKSQSHFVCLTAFIVSVGNHWYVVTAGHNIDDWRSAVGAGEQAQIVGEALADYFGPDPTRTDPLRFDLFGLPFLHEWKRVDDLDYAFILIPEGLREAMQENSILPLRINEGRTNYDDFYGFGLVGFPDEDCGPESPNDPTCRTAIVHPTLIPLKLDKRATKSFQAPAFIADAITTGNQQSILGMSGGPVFGYLAGADGNSAYEVVAIQSRCDDEKKSIAACSILVALERIRVKIRAGMSESD